MLQLLASVSDIYSYPTRLIVHLLYACGLRVSEPLNLRIKDIDLKQHRLYVHQAKGNKGRVVLFPDCLTPALQRQLEVARTGVKPWIYAFCLLTASRWRILISHAS